MSFASEMKTELAKIKLDSCCKRAELAAFLQLNSEIILNSEGAHLSFQTMNNAVARCYISLIKEIYSTEINLYTRVQNLTKEEVYIVIADEAKKIIEEESLLSVDYQTKGQFINSECCKAAYLRGAFMAMGSINNPLNSYHLEIKCKDQLDTIFIQSLMNSLDLNAKISKRRNELIVYLKDAQSIADFMLVIGAKTAYFAFEEIRVNKNFKNMVNRKTNCELANTEKSVMAANQQMKEIAVLEKKFPREKIDEKLIEIMEIRKKNPVASYQELLEIYENEYGKRITKSGLIHRFRRIHELAYE